MLKAMQKTMQKTIIQKRMHSLISLTGKSLFLLFYFLFFTTNSYAVLEVEIKGGFQSANPIAIVPFSWSQSGKAPVDIVEKVKEKHMGLEEKKQKLQANLDRIRQLEH